MELTGKRLLVLEDEYLIGLELERIAEECGARSVKLAATIDELLAFIHSGAHCDIAIIEVQARGSSSLDAAVLLKERGVPVIFTTAYEADRDGIPGFQGAPIIGKPYGKSQVVQAVAALAKLDVKVPLNGGVRRTYLR